MTPKEIAEAWLYLKGDGSYHRYTPDRNEGTAEKCLAADRKALARTIELTIAAACRIVPAVQAGIKPETLWLIVGHLLRDLSLARWPQAAVWARSLLAQLRKLGGAQ